MVELTEDEVRNSAGGILGFTIIGPNGEMINVDTEQLHSGVGQLTTFIELGKKLKISEFNGYRDKPDGWYLPTNFGKPAIVLETKSSSEDIRLQKWVDELQKNMNIVSKKYSKVVGILWNGIEQRIFVNEKEMFDVANTLQNKDYYISLCVNDKIDKMHIYDVTKRINDNLAFNFGMTDLQDRMIFTACALVAQRYFPVPGLKNLKNMGYNTFKNWIFDSLSKAITEDKRQNEKLDVLLDTYSTIKISIEKQDSINKFIDDVCEVSELVNSNNWNGEDVMAIFFNEFNRYRGKAQAGQVFTPDHVTSFMYRLIDVHMNDKVLDATCGSGAFLVKAMCNMMQEAGGVNTDKASEIKEGQLFGIEMYNKVFALACANMMIHKDGKTNLALLDAREKEASDWIRWEKAPTKFDEKGNPINGVPRNISKVLMNPPYERKYGCMKIVRNVLDSVPKGTPCAFILPDKKLEKDGADKKYGNKVLKDHTLKTIIKMPENLFLNGTTPSIFIFEAGRPQGNDNIIGYYIEDDGLETVKNKGRQDIRNRWEEKEDYWIKAIHDGNDYLYNTRQIINPKEHLSYQLPEKPFEITEEDFTKTVLNYMMFEDGIDVKEFNEKVLSKVIYGSAISSTDDSVQIIVNKSSNGVKMDEENN